MAAGSPESCITSGTAVCMRNASSYDLIRARSAASIGILESRETIQSAQQLKFARLLFAEHVPGRRRERKRIPGIDRKLDAVVLGTQVARPMAAQTAATVRNRRADHDESRQVIARVSPGHSEPTSRSSETGPSSMCRPVWN